MITGIQATFVRIPKRLREHMKMVEVERGANCLTYNDLPWLSSKSFDLHWTNVATKAARKAMTSSTATPMASINRSSSLVRRPKNDGL